MSAQYRTTNVVERELARRLEAAQADNKVAVVEIAGNLYRLVPVSDVRTNDLAAGKFDPEDARAKVEAAAGALRGLDIEEFLEEIMESRIQDTPHRTF